MDNSQTSIENNFAEFMQESLYGSDGFYTKGGGAGRDRDYLTSPEVGDLFGFVVAAYIDRWYESLDDEGYVIVLEVGCGPGSLAASIARASMHNAESIQYRLVDISPVHRETTENKLRNSAPAFAWSVHEHIPECEAPTLVITNELLDNLVFNIGRTTEVYQPYEPDKLKVGEWAAKFGISGSIDSLSGADVPHDLGDYRIPLHVGIVDWLSELMEATANVTDLSLLFFDYMNSVTWMNEENWLRLYANNQRVVGVDNVLTALASGVKGDITTDVTAEDLRVILDTEGFSNISLQMQAKWLYKNGIDSFCSDTAPQSSYDQLEQWVQGDKQSATTSSFTNERETLTDESALGGFTALTARRAI